MIVVESIMTTIECLLIHLLLLSIVQLSLLIKLLI